MSYEKHKVTTDALDTLGTIIDDTQKRDAIHLAVMPVVAGANLAPGQHVRIDKDGLAVSSYGEDGDPPPIGIVDPFLPRKHDSVDGWGSIKPGQRFWLVIYPRVISSLRHVWTHPALPDETAALETQVADAREESRKWLEAFAARLFSYEPHEEDGHGSRFDVLMDGAEHGAFGTDIEYGEDCNPNDEFWMHYERYTGRKVVKRHEYFRCAC